MIIFLNLLSKIIHELNNLMLSIYSLNYFCVEYYIQLFKKYPTCIATYNGIYNFEVKKYNLEILKLKNKIKDINKLKKNQIYNINQVNQYRINLINVNIYKDIINKFIKNKKYFIKILIKILNIIFKSYFDFKFSSFKIDENKNFGLDKLRNILYIFENIVSLCSSEYVKYEIELKNFVCNLYIKID